MGTAAPSWRLVALATYTATAVLALGVSVANAKAASASASCPGVAEHPFLPWLDPAAYVLAPGGDFEGKTTTWKLAQGAKPVSGNEPFKVHRSTDSRSLAIPAGGSATSPPICVGLGDPTLRLFAVGGNPTSPLKVEVVYKTLLGTQTQLVTFVPASASWGPTPQAVFLANVTGLTSLDGLTTSVQFRFTALGTAGWTIDDVYVDPWKVT